MIKPSDFGQSPSHSTACTRLLCVASHPQGAIKPGPRVRSLLRRAVQYPKTEISCSGLLNTFFKLCWRFGQNLQQWKDSTTTLIHKEGPVTDPQIHRPVGLQQSLHKLWSNFVTAVLQNYAEQHNFLSDAQEGFKPGKYCACQLQMLTSVVEDAKLHSQDV